ncbi:MAG TPA: GNAT family N-acetyltransferase [Gemmatimonadaceae bacterium]|nr:GNAT family N-acetyltransferase [Gemmatimonadaceae bacterium]
MARAVRTGPLTRAHRGRVAAILQATGVFRTDEVDVALELFDEASSDDEPGAGDVQPSSPHAPSSPATRSIPSYVFLGAFTPDDALIGFACHGPTPGTDRTHDLYWIAVDPSRQSAGVGTTLLHEVEGHLQGQHARLLVVETSSRSDYEPTRRFYGRRGFTEAARVRGFYAPDDDRIILTKRFQPPARAGSVTP